MDPWYRIGETVLAPPLKLWFNWRLDGVERIDPRGPVLLACNHISYFDAVALGYMMFLAGRRPRFLAKSELFKNVFLRKVLSSSGQIPVERGTGSPAPLAAAGEHLEMGEAVIIFPEGTTTKREDFGMQPAKTGVARLALSSGVPVLPASIWGSHRVWKHGNRIPAFARPIWVRTGEPMTFPESQRGEDPEVLREVTDRIMSEIGRISADLRAEYPERWK